VGAGVCSEPPRRKERRRKKERKKGKVGAKAMVSFLFFTPVYFLGGPGTQRRE
jgi:hypothetical protein